MAFKPVQAFTDLHHLTTQTTYFDGDFPLMAREEEMPNGTANDNTAKIHPDLRNNNTAWDLTETEIFNLGIFPGFQTRSLVVDNSGNVSGSKRHAYILMGRDGNTGPVDPTYFLRDPAPNSTTPGPQQQFNANGFDQLVIELDHKKSFQKHIVGLMFVDSNGFPKTVTISGVDYIGLGEFNQKGSAFGNTQMSLLKPVSYGSNSTTPSDSAKNANNIFISGSPGRDVTLKYRYIFDRDSSQFAVIEEGTEVLVVGPVNVSQSITDAIFNNKCVPISYGLENDNSANNNSFFNWSVYFRNKLDV